MSVYAGPEISNENLVLCLDAGNKKSFDPRENLYPHSETLQTLSNSRCTRQSFSTGGPFGTGYQEFTVTEAAEGNIYNFDGGNTITLTAGQVITFSAYFQNISLSGGIYLRCWTGTGRAWTTRRQVQYNLTSLTSTPSTGGTILDHSISLESNGFYRLSMTIQADQNGFSAISINVGGQIGEKYRATAVQVSNGYALTEYLPTTGAAIVRSTTWLDTTGNGYNATLINGPSYNNLGFISFNGTNQYATHNLPSISSGSDNFTFELIFKVRTLPTIAYGPNGQIWGGEIGNDIVSYIVPAVNGVSKLNLNYDDSRYSGDTPGHYTSSGITANQWVHWVAQGRFSDNTIAHYINGKLDSDFTSVVSGQELNSRNSDGKIAYDTRWNTYTELDLAVIREYHRILSASEIQQNFNALRGRFGL